MPVQRSISESPSRGGVEMVSTFKGSIYLGRIFAYEIFSWDCQWPSQEKTYAISYRMMG
jgi:hypothetical protein